MDRATIDQLFQSATSDIPAFDEEGYFNPQNWMDDRIIYLIEFVHKLPDGYSYFGTSRKGGLYVYLVHMNNRRLVTMANGAGMYFIDLCQRHRIEVFELNGIPITADQLKSLMYRIAAAFSFTNPTMPKRPGQRIRLG